MRHNAIRDTEASLMKEVAKDVETEPHLLPVGNTQPKAGSNIQTKARLDISARGIWSSQERTFFDVRVTHPHAPSNVGKALDVLLLDNEKEKMVKYNDRVLQVEKSSFVPLVFSTSGAMSIQCQRLHKQLASLIARKKGEKYSIVMGHIRTRLRFSLLRSTLIAIRGFRGGRKEAIVDPVTEIDFGLVAV